MLFRWQKNKLIHELPSATGSAFPLLLEGLKIDSYTQHTHTERSRNVFINLANNIFLFTSCFSQNL